MTVPVTVPSSPERPPRPGRLPFSRRGILLLLCLGLTLAVALGLALRSHVVDHRASLLREHGEALSSAARGHSHQVSDWLRERRREAAFMNSHEPLHRMVHTLRSDGPGAAAAEGMFRATLEWLLGTRNYRNIRMVDARDGAVLLEAGVTSNPWTPPDPAAVAGALRDGFAMGSIAPRRAGGLLLDFVTSVGSGSEPTVIVLRVDPEDHLLPLIQAAPIEDRAAEAFLVVREGNEAVFLIRPRHGDPGTVLARRPLSDPDLPAAAVLQGTRGLVQGRDYRGEPVLAALWPVEGAPWGIVAKMDLSEVDAEVRASALSLGTTAILLFLLCGAGAGALLWRRRVRENLRTREEELRRREVEERLASVVQDANEAILLADEDLRVREFNDQALRFYGYTREEMARINIRDIRAPSTLDRIREDIDNMDTGSGRVYETVHRRKDGTEFPVEVSLRSVRRGGKVYYQGIVRDISERRRAEEDLAAARAAFLQAQKMEALGRLAGGVAHQINNQLTATLGFADLALAQIPPGEPGRPEVEMVRESAARTADLGRGLLAYSGKEMRRPRVVDLDAALREFHGDLRRAAREGVDLRLSLNAGGARVFVDPDQLRFVVIEMVCGARDAMPAGEILEIATAGASRVAPEGAGPGESPAEFAGISFLDSGAEVPEKDLPKVFDPFYSRGPGPWVEDMGLAAAEGVVRQNGGWIRARRREGGGMAFTVFLPVAADPPAAEPPDPPVLTLTPRR